MAQELGDVIGEAMSLRLLAFVHLAQAIICPAVNHDIILQICYILNNIFELLAFVYLAQADEYEIYALFLRDYYYNM